MATRRKGASRRESCAKPLDPDREHYSGRDWASNAKKLAVGGKGLDRQLKMHNNPLYTLYPFDTFITGSLAIVKPQRQAALLRLIASQPVANQSQIVALMRREGFEATQASISRDIRDLGLVKLAGRYVSAEQAMAAPSDGEPLGLEAGLIHSLEPVGANMIVVKTRPGAASSVAVVLDRELADISAGSVAGDDTLFIAARSRSDQGRVVARLNAWLKMNPPERLAASSVSARVRSPKG
jgi:transcriptional regulator of arginine metabolism